MRKILLSCLIFVFFFSFVVLAGEQPQTVIEKPGLSAKEKSDTYSPVKQFNNFQGKYATGSNPSIEAVFLNEGFEGAFPPADWTLIQTIADTGFTQTDVLAHTGTYSALHSYHVGQEDNWMVTSAIDLTGSALARLNFWQYEKYSDYYLSHQVYVTTDTTGIMGDTTAWDLVYEGVGTEDTWEQILVDLSGYDGQTIFVGFYYSGDDADEWYIDDVVVEDTPTTPVMFTLYSELNAPATPVDSTVSDMFGIVTNTGLSALNISSITLTNPDFSVTPTTGTVDPGDTLFVEASFTPSTAGLITGLMIISGDDPGNPLDTIRVSGVGYSESYVVEEFNDFPYYPYNFSRINANGDNVRWGWYLLGGTELVAGIGYHSPSNNDYLVTPPIPVVSGDFISFESWVQGASYPETWQVLVSTTDKQPASFTIGLDTVTSSITSPYRYTYDLSAFDGQTIYVAIRNVSADMYYQWVDNVIMPMPKYPTFINEIYYDSPGADNGTFTEIYGKPGLDLTGYILDGNNGNGGVSYRQIDLSGNVIPEDGFFVVGQDTSVPNADLITTDVDWQNGPDNVLLMHGSDTLDAIGYGDFSSAVFVGEGNPVPEPYTTYGLGRYPDGFDTDDNAADFYPNYLSPGESNYLPSGIIGGGASLAFDTTDVGMRDTLNYTIYNNGGTGLIISNIVTSNPAFIAQWPDGSVDSTIAFGASAVLDVIFAPGAEITYDESMTIYNNDLFNGTRVVPLTGTGELTGEGASVILAAQIGGDSQYRSFWVNGSWDASGVYDSDWTGPMVELKDDGSTPDAVAGDHIFTGFVNLAIDNTNTYRWWTGSENDINSFLDDGANFNVSEAMTLFPDTLVVDGDGGINQWVISLAGDFNGWTNSDMRRNGTVWSIVYPFITAGTHEYKYTVMHQWNAAYGEGGIGSAGSNFSFTAPDSGAYRFTFDDADNSQSVGPVVVMPYFFDDFEAYTAGTQLTVQNPGVWRTWSGASGGGEDPFVSDDTAYSGSNSVVIVADNDLVKPLGTQAKGRWTIEFQIFIPDGRSGYFNTLADFAGSNSEWAMDVYFDEGGGGRLITENGTATAFTFSYDIWQSCKVYADLNTDVGEFWFNGSLVHTWPWTEGSGGTVPLQLSANDFFGAAATDSMFVDDYTVFADTLDLARVQVIHNAADPAANSVDVYVNGNLTIPDFNFRSATPYLDLPAGEPTNIGIAPANSSSVNDTLKNIRVTLVPNETYVVIANGVMDPGNFAPNPNGLDIGFTFLLKPDARETGTGTGVDFFGVHGLTDAPAIDIRVQGGSTLFDNLLYGSITDYQTLAPFNYTLQILDSAQSTVIYTISNVDLSGLSGQSAVLLGSGFIDPAANQNGASIVLMAALADGKVRVFDQVTGIDDNQNAIPTEFALDQNYPNPFNPTTSIKYALKENTKVILKIYNLLGQEVRTLVNGNQEAGYKKVAWDGMNNKGTRVASGIYIYRIKAGDFVKARKMILMK
jgi:hypothetical protein